MQVLHVVGAWLVAGLIIFLVGAAAWRLDYEKPLPDALHVIHGDRRRRAWIHLWMIPAWAAERTVEDGTPPQGFAALDRWAGSLYIVHMGTAYGAFVLLGSAVLTAGDLPRWVGWLGIAWGLTFLAGFAATRFSGPFNPPFWAHAYTGLLGGMLLWS